MQECLTCEITIRLTSTADAFRQKIYQTDEITVCWEFSNVDMELIKRIFNEKIIKGELRLKLQPNLIHSKAFEKDMLSF